MVGIAAVPCCAVGLGTTNQTTCVRLSEAGTNLRIVTSSTAFGLPRTRHRRGLFFVALATFTPKALAFGRFLFFTGLPSGLRLVAAVLRGGSWNNKPDNLRSANRNRNERAKRNNNNGFRLAQSALYNYQSWFVYGYTKRIYRVSMMVVLPSQEGSGK